MSRLDGHITRANDEKKNAQFVTKVIPTMSDCYIGYASAPGYKSYRNHKTGSFYISALVEVFLMNAHNTELYSMMLEVKNTVSNTAIYCEGKDGKVITCIQMPVEDNSLRKELYFNRGQFH